MSYYTRNYEQNGIEIYFNKKPSEAVRDRLKMNGWRWSNFKKCWYNYYSQEHLQFADAICDAGKKKSTSVKTTASTSNIGNTITPRNQNAEVATETIRLTKKSFINEGDRCVVVVTDGKKCLGQVSGVDDVNSKALVTYITEITNWGYQHKDVAWFEEKNVRKHSDIVYGFQVTTGRVVSFQSKSEGIIKGRISGLNYDNTYDIQYYRIESDGTICVYEDEDIPLDLIVDVEYDGDIYPLKVGDKVEFLKDYETETMGRVNNINGDGSVDIVYEHIDRWGDKEKIVEYYVPLENVKLMARGRKALERSVYITPEKQKNIDENENIIARIKNREDAFEDATSIRNSALYRHQKAGTILADKYDRFAFFYDTGTGKTVMTLDIIANKEQSDNARFLIIAPKSIIKTAWMDDAKKFYPDLKILPLYKGFTDEKKRELLCRWTKGKYYDSNSPYVKLLHTILGVSSPETTSGESIDDQLASMAQHYIINSELFIRNPKHYIRSLGITGIVMDESAILKNYNGKTSKIMREITTEMKYVYLLSGKPAPNNVVEYFSQMKIVDPDTFSMSFDNFIGMFCYGPKNTMIEANKKLFAEMVSVKSLIISKKDCLDLPDCVDIVRQIELPEDVMADYDELYRECMAIIKGMDQSSVFYSSQSKLAVLMKLRQMASGFFITESNGYRETRDIVDIHNEKLGELNGILDQLEDEQVIVWAQFQHEIELIERELKKRATVVTAYGKTKNLEGSIDEFKTGRAKYIVANPKTLKYGVTFTNCKYVVYYSFSYSAEDYDQSHDRNYRLGQTEQCTYIYLQSADTIDEIMYAKVRYKLTNAEFFEQLIKDASKHGIDYASLKPKSDGEIKESMSDDEGSLKLILNDLSQKQNKKIIEEYLKNNVAEDKEYLNCLVPSKDDIHRATKSCFAQVLELERDGGFIAYDDMDIEDILLSWSAYSALKGAHINTVGDLYLTTEDTLMRLLDSDALYEEVQLKLGAISIFMLRKYMKEIKKKKINHTFVEEVEVQNQRTDLQHVSIEDMLLSIRSYNCLKRAGITNLYELTERSTADLMKVRNLGRKSMMEVIEKMAEYGVAPADMDVPVCRNKVSTFDDFSIDDLELSVRSFNVLKRAGINSVGDLTRRTYDDLTRVRNMGRKSLEEILSKMEALGATLSEEGVIENQFEFLDEELVELEPELEDDFVDEDYIIIEEYQNNQDVYSKFHEIVREEGIEKGIEYLKTAVENGYAGDYSIIHSYYLVGYKGVGGKQWDKSFEWMTRFYNDYESGRLVLEDDFEFNRATYDYNLGIFNLKFLDSIGDRELGIKFLKDCIIHTTEHDGDSNTNLSKIAVSMLGITMDIYGSSISMGCDMEAAVAALQKDAELGNTVAKQMVAHVKRDGYDLNDVDQLLIDLNDKENVYLLALCFKYGYVVPTNVSEYEKLLKDVFGDSIDYLEYQEKHSDMTEERENDLIFEDVRILDDTDCLVDFCGLDINKEREIIEVKVWVYNKSNSHYNVWLKGLNINETHVSSFEDLGEIEAHDSKYMEYQISSSEIPVSFDAVKNMKFSVEIDNEDNDELFTSEVVTLSMKTGLGTFIVKR